jgi:hypothetical protein
MTWEDPYSPTGTFQAIYALARGYRCDHTGVREATCEPFAMMFQQITEFERRRSTGRDARISARRPAREW